MNPWVEKNRGFLIYLAAALALTVLLGVLYFLFGHQWLTESRHGSRSHIEESESRHGFSRFAPTLEESESRHGFSRFAPTLEESRDGARSHTERFFEWSLGEEVRTPETALAAADEFVKHLLVGLFLVLLLAGWLIWRPGLPPKEVVNCLIMYGFLAALYLSVSQIAVFAAYKEPGFHNWDRMSWDKTVEMGGYVRSPRVLTPWLIRCVKKVIPEVRRAELRRTIRQNGFYQELSLKTHGRDGYELDFVISVVIMVLFLCLAMVAAGSLAKTFFAVPALHYRVLIPVCFGLFLPIFYRNSTYVYDMTNLCFITVGYLLLVRKRLIWFHLFFALALLNKESFILTSVVFLVLMWDRLPWRSYVLCLGFQGAYFIGLRLLLLRVFGAGAGELFISNTAANLDWLWHNNVWYFFTEVDRTAYYFSLFYLLALVLLAIWQWRRKHPVLRLAGAAVFIVLFIINLIMVVFWEWRDFYEVYPLLFLLAYETIGKIFDVVKHRPVLAEKPEGSFKNLFMAKLSQVRGR